MPHSVRVKSASFYDTLSDLRSVSATAIETLCSDCSHRCKFLCHYNALSRSLPYSYVWFYLFSAVIGNLTTLSALFLQCACFRTPFRVQSQTVPERVSIRSMGKSCMDCFLKTCLRLIGPRISDTCIAACLFRFRKSSSRVACHSPSFRIRLHPVTIKPCSISGVSSPS
jgi:hypothetical protein